MAPAVLGWRHHVSGHELLAGWEKLSSTSLLLPVQMEILTSVLRVPWTDEVALHMLLTTVKKTLLFLKL